jgi:hypothetical protein
LSRRRTGEGTGIAAGAGARSAFMGAKEAGTFWGDSQEAARPVMMTQALGLNRAYYRGEIIRPVYPAIVEEL